ncbi:MAG: DUF624 domain-containing protein [Ruminococcaceae bacterium]|nr:DUF624 domain-containing protein [Oscillospiraceae bacterium]
MHMFFKSYYNEGPGVSPNETEKTGMAKYFELLFNDFWSFIGISMLYLLSCLPIVTIGGATLAFNRLCCKRISRKHVFVLDDFKESFRENFKKGILLSFIIIFVIVDLIILYSNALGYMEGDERGRQAVIVWAFCCITAILLFAILQYLIMVIANFEPQPFVQQLQNAVLLMISGGIRTLVMAIFDIVVFAVCFTYFPFSGMVLFAGGFFILFFTNCFWTWPVVLKQVERPAEEQNENEAEQPDCELEEAEEAEQLVDSETIG